MAKPKKQLKSKKKRRDEDEEMDDEEELSDVDIEDEEDADEDDGDAVARKKKRKNAFIDDAAEVDDDEEDEDVGPSRRVKRNRFIDDIAAVDEDEEDEEEDDEVDDLIHDEGEELPDERDLARVYRRVEADQRARDADMSPEELEEYVKRRFEQRGFDTGDMGEEQAGVVGQQGLLPTHDDPKLWLVELKAGTEREAVICLMQKAVAFAEKGTPLLIKSAFVQDHLKGYMYVEAYKEAHVKEAIRGLRVFYQSKGAKLVPTREMVDAITVNRAAKAQLDVKAWVRPRAGMYKNDLGQIVDIDHSSGKCTVRLIPRLDYAGMAQRREEGRSGLPFGRAPAVKPTAKAFSEIEAREHRMIVEKRVRRDSEGGYVYYLNGNTQQYYIDGYLHKPVSIKSLLQVEGNPPVEELQRFSQIQQQARQADGETNGDLANLMQTLAADDDGVKKSQVTYNKGDAVMVTEGDLKTMLGKVVNVGDDGKVYMQPQIKGLDVLPFDPSQLTKYFKSGDHVKVVNGAAAGQTGMVVSVDATTNICIILTDAHKEEVQVFARDLSESNETAFANDTWGEYELHNLVALDQTTVGVIVAIEADSARILTNQGTGGTPDIRVCKPQDVKRKLFPNRATVTHDSAQNSVSAGDIVDIKEGPLKGRSGTVKFVHRMFLFLHSKEYPDNGGFVCVRGRQCLLRGGAKTGGLTGLGSSMLSMKSPAPHRFGGMNGGVNASPRRDGHNGMTGSNAFGAVPAFSGRTLTHRDDGLVGQSITIAKGPHRGYKGRVISATATHVRMELQAQYKTVNVDRKFLPAEYAGPQPRRAPAGFGGGMGPPPASHHAGGRTPLHPGSATPMHSWGSATPMHPSMTPMHAGSATPMRDSAWNPGAQTPRHPSSDAEHADTPGSYYAAQADTPQTYYGGQAGTPGYNSAYTPAAAQAGTPAYNNPYTPAETPAGTPGGTDLGQPARTPGIAESPFPGGPAETPAYDAPTPGYAVAGTPGAGIAPRYGAPTPGYGMAGTPGTGMTPGLTPGFPTPMMNVHTPGTPGFDAVSPVVAESGGTEEARDWDQYVGVAVVLGDGKIGVIRSTDPRGQCQVVPAFELEDGAIEVDPNGEPVTVAGASLQTSELVKKNTRVKIVRGESRGMFATCIATNFPDGIIKLRNEEVRVLDLANLARAEGPAPTVF